MRRNRSFLLFPFVLIAALTVFSCSKNNDTKTGSIEFMMDPVMGDALKSTGTNYYNVTAALVTIVNQEGVMVYDKEYLPFYIFGQSFVTKSLQLNVGRYMLTEFMLVDSSGNVTWATPAEGSRLAPLVDDPVPVQFNVFADNTTQVNPQVVRVANHQPDDFGYVNFDVEFIDNFCINLYLESQCSGPMYDSMYNDSMYMETGIGMPIYPSRIAIFNEGNFLTESFLTTGKNRVPVPRGYEVYNLRVFDCGNQLCFSERFTADQLRKFRCDSGEFLYIKCGPPQTAITITPEDITKPTIEQGVFGQITEPWLDTGNVWNDSTLVDPEGFAETDPYPMMTDIYIYKTQPEDTVFYPASQANCYYYPDLHMQPHAVVRTNSSGYYQLPLEAGTYSYLVKTPFGFYIDAWVSSHRPGKFEVRVGEITILNIYVQPCLWY